MRAIILAAGRGYRLRPLTDSRPKCLVQVNSKPILAYQIEALFKANIEEIFIVAGYRLRDIKAFLKRYITPKITIVTNQEFASTNNMPSF